MSRTDTLKSLEVVLESFLERAVALKADRLPVLEGINRLDDIARSRENDLDALGHDLTDRVGNWFAAHRDWMVNQTLQPADCNRISKILTNIRTELGRADQSSPARQKIGAEIGRWQANLADRSGPAPDTATRPRRRIVLRKGTESLDEAGVHPSSQDSVGLFTGSLQAISAIFADLSHDRGHLMSILDDTLKSAALQKSREALLLSALIIYYLKRNGYMVEPFVRRLKEAERLQEEGSGVA